MTQLTRGFKEHSIIWIIITTLAGLAGGFVSSWLTYHYVERQKLVDTVVAQIEQKRAESRIEKDKERDDRVRKEALLWANPILGSVKNLRERLDNILNSGGHLALDVKATPTERWSVSHEYFSNSTLFLFAEYFSWIQMFRSKMSFELFQSQAEKDELIRKIKEVESALSDFPPRGYTCNDRDVQVFEVQQRAIGELIVVPQPDGTRSIMTYPEFTKKLGDPTFKRNFAPLEQLLSGLDRQHECRWLRLHKVKNTLDSLNESCETLLQNNTMPTK